jgi:hypothetical protein
MKAGTLPRLSYDTILCDVLNGDDIEFWREHRQEVIRAVQIALRSTQPGADRWEFISEVVNELAQEWAHLRAAA